ncbi:hypothetical protein [Clostridium kluyveri]|nr:hypothetical protein [Clostridium kluyveri]
MDKQTYTKKEVEQLLNELEIKLRIKEDIIKALLIQIKDLSSRR